jgi:hypothetical protein
MKKTRMNNLKKEKPMAQETSTRLLGFFLMFPRHTVVITALAP